MFKYAARVRIGCPPARVFDYLADPAKLGDWIGGLESTVALDPGPPAEGSRYRQVLRIGGSRQTAERELTAFDPDRLLAFRITSAAITIDARFELTGDETGTALGYTHAGETKGLAGALLGRTIQRELSSKIEEDLRTLKRVAEAGARGDSAG